jgi:translation initiation factor IF-2
MGHIDHGKSTLLAYIRKSTQPLNEAGGITQHVSAYEVEHESSEGKIHPITFIDTPGHEAFSGIRQRGAHVADIAILVVSAEDGVKPQTLEALKSITDSGIPYIVAINKIDRPEANVERTKQSLAEHEIYIEGYGRDVPAVAISAKTGEGVPELLDMIVLVSEIQGLVGDRNKLGTGVVIESNRDVKKGVCATCIIKDGTIRKGMFIAAGKSIAPVRIMENYKGVQVAEASFSSPVRIIGWDSLPQVGSNFAVYENKNDALAHVEQENTRVMHPNTNTTYNPDTATLPVIIKADAGGSLEAVLYEIKKITNDRIRAEVVSSGIGTISENDIQLASAGTRHAIVIGFNTKVDSSAKHLAERNEIEIKTFDIIYKLSEWLADMLEKHTPKIQVKESTGRAKILKLFSKVKDRQIIGGRVETGTIKLGGQVIIFRRDAEIGEGKVKELQQQKNRSDEVGEGKEFGAMIEAKIELAPGDYIESFMITEK